MALGSALTGAVSNVLIAKCHQVEQMSNILEIIITFKVLHNSFHSILQELHDSVFLVFYGSRDSDGCLIFMTYKRSPPL